MSTTNTVNPGAVVIWCENPDPNEYDIEHAIVVQPFSDAVGIEQNGNTITVPRYAVRDLVKALRAIGKEA